MAIGQLKDDTEVWLSHANGDPDRPLILGATHHGMQPDAVSAKDNSRNVLRTLAGNKLRMEDRQGEEHIKLGTPHGLSQLNLGHAVDHDWSPRDDVPIPDEHVKHGNPLPMASGVTRMAFCNSARSSGNWSGGRLNDDTELGAQRRPR